MRTTLQTLFDISPVLPQGFSYYPNFITPIEEIGIVSSIEQFELQTMKFHQYEAKRKVLSFGSGWSFTEQKLKPATDIPVLFDPLLERIAAKLVIPKERIAQLLITEYPPGSVINWHRDAPPFDMIAGISLLADCNFKLRPHDKTKQSRDATISLEVERRSLYIMQGPAKNEWQHSTAPLNTLRYSLTFRTLK
jgi:alkylated DNA repair dioxygenase AlkB